MALGLALAGSRERARLLLLLGRAQLFLGQFDGTTLAAAAEELIALGENEAAAEAEAALGNACWLRGDRDLADGISPGRAIWSSTRRPLRSRRR